MGSESQRARQHKIHSGSQFQPWRDYSLQKQERWGVRKETERINIYTSKPATELGVKVSLSRLWSLSSVQSVILPANHRFDIFNTFTFPKISVSQAVGSSKQKADWITSPETKMISSFCYKSSWIYTRLLLLCPLFLFYHLFFFPK